MSDSTRYFTDDYGVWKFEPGQPPMYRDCEETEWENSGFTSFSEFERSPGDTREITPDQG